MEKKNSIKKIVMACLTGIMIISTASCSGEVELSANLVEQEEENERVVTLFSPMEKTKPDADNAARNASEKTVRMAEEKLGVTVNYITYTAEDYQDKTYDEVSLDRARNNMDDLYLLNPDVIQKLAEEGKLMDLSGIDNAKNLRDVVKTANVVDGKLIAIPQEVVAYGLFINKDIFDVKEGDVIEAPARTEFTYSGKMQLILIMTPDFKAENDVDTKKENDLH